jgi:hypothetical protein
VNDSPFCALFPNRAKVPNGLALPQGNGKVEGGHLRVLMQKPNGLCAFVLATQTVRKKGSSNESSDYSTC